MFAVALMLMYAAGFAWAVAVHVVPAWGVWGLVALNALTFAAYGLDKRAATRGKWRTRERTLHLWSLAGGWPAAWWAQQLLRHKSAKVSFLRIYWGTVVLHGLVAMGWAGYRLGLHGA